MALERLPESDRASLLTTLLSSFHNGTDPGTKNQQPTCFSTKTKMLTDLLATLWVHKYSFMTSKVKERKCYSSLLMTLFLSVALRA